MVGGAGVGAVGNGRLRVAVEAEAMLSSGRVVVRAVRIVGFQMYCVFELRPLFVAVVVGTEIWAGGERKTVRQCKMKEAWLLTLGRNKQKMWVREWRRRGQ